MPSRLYSPHDRQPAPRPHSRRIYQTTIDMRARQLKADVFSTPSTISLD
ncbi:MAG: hypothetical protein ACXW6J_13840 [Candidatus Binatia bacterium]